jgi:hypothetical protein
LSTATRLSRRRAAGLALAVLGGLLAACSPAPPAATPAAPAPVPDAGAATASKPQISRTGKLAAFLRKRYGATARLSGTWTGRWQNEDAEQRAVSWRLCAEQPVVGGDDWQQLLAVCGTLEGAAHPDPGVIDFYVLRDAGDHFEPAATLNGATFGSMGDPGKVTILRLGSDFYGFRIEHAWAGQGYLLASQDLVVPSPHGLVDAGSLRSHIDNRSALDCAADDAACQAQAFDIDFELRVDDSNPSTRIWPLLVTERGDSCGQPLQREHRFSLDTQTWKYRFTEALQREDCH